MADRNGTLGLWECSGIRGSSCITLSLDGKLSRRTLSSALSLLHENKGEIEKNPGVIWGQLGHRSALAGPPPPPWWAQHSRTSETCASLKGTPSSEAFRWRRPSRGQQG